MLMTNNEEQTINTEENKENTHFKNFRDGTLSVTEWVHKNDKDGSTWYSYTVQRSYNKNKDPKGEADWQNTNSLREQDLLKVANLLQQAYVERKRQENEDKN